MKGMFDSESSNITGVICIGTKDQALAAAGLPKTDGSDRSLYAWAVVEGQAQFLRNLSPTDKFRGPLVVWIEVSSGPKTKPGIEDSHYMKLGPDLARAVSDPLPIHSHEDLIIHIGGFDSKGHLNEYFTSSQFVTVEPPMHIELGSPVPPQDLGPLTDSIIG